MKNTDKPTQTNITLPEYMSLSERIETEKIIYEVLQYDVLQKGKNHSWLEGYKNTQFSRLKQVRIIMKDSSVMLESGALHYMLGNIEIKTSLGNDSSGSNNGFFGGIKKAASSVVTGESIFKPIYNGSGEIFLEPSLEHFILVQIENDELIVDKGLYYACDNNIEISAFIQKGFKAAVAGGEGLFQPWLKGTGVIVLKSPIPMSEMSIIELNNDVLKVDGSFAMMRTGGIDFTVEKSAKGLFASSSTGEGLLQVFKGTGTVWLAPTEGQY